ncbi:MAG: lasso peptide biosynthesis protein [Elusimicrobiales bacterium]|nr:lasso peptide biosynthesis protein [Elusimicrobiales bacterium]MCK5357437.1 lasso peptide biosynthesis protein [Elusimicrobiales bacterium]MCK5583467.1 lasso peptide biosynthesis protein [Elusimicrobiales bacterium]
MSIFKKIYFYRDVKVFYWIIVVFTEVSLKIFLGKEGSLLNIDEKKINIKNKTCSREKIEKYVKFFFYVKSYFGRKEYCFVKSLVLYAVLRKHGYNAGIKFSAVKMEKGKEFPETLSGHCWVVVDEKNSNLNENIIFKFS